MKITTIYGAVPGNDFGLIKIKNVVIETFNELGITVEDVNLFYNGLSYFDGVKSDAVKPISTAIKQADGIVLLTTANYGIANSMMINLFEHLSYVEYRDSFLGKNCMVAIVSEDKASQNAMHGLSSTLSILGAIDCVRFAVDDHFTQHIEVNGHYKEMVEKQVEDFYRMVRQQRKFYIPTDAPTASSIAQPQMEEKDLNPVEIQAKKIIEQVTTDNFSDKQQQDIEEIAQFFSKKLNSIEKEQSPAEGENNKGAALRMKPVPEQNRELSPQELFFSQSPVPQPAPEKSCRQLSASLVHFFQPQLSAGLNAVIQLSITGEESFEGYIMIDNIECDYKDGTYPTPDVTIITSSEVWKGVLTGKNTTQKAFMIGQLKVRGNFSLLTRFDQLFKTDKNIK